MRILFVVAALTAAGAASAGDLVDMSGPYVGGGLSRSTAGSANLYPYPWDVWAGIPTFSSADVISSPKGEFPDFDGTLSAQMPGWWSASAIAGYNWEIGDTIIGVEGRVSFGLNKSEITSSSVNQWGGPPIGRDGGGQHYLWWDQPIGAEFIQQADVLWRTTTDTRYSYSLEEIASPDIVLRLGRRIDNLLLFAKIGGGVSLIEERETFDDTRTTYCTVQQFRSVITGPSGSFERFNEGCVQFTHGVAGTRSETKLVPTVILGVGGEYHWDKYFLRGEVEFRYLVGEVSDLKQSTDLSSQIRLGTSIGLKF